MDVVIRLKFKRWDECRNTVSEEDASGMHAGRFDLVIAQAAQMIAGFKRYKKRAEKKGKGTPCQAVAILEKDGVQVWSCSLPCVEPCLPDLSSYTEGDPDSTETVRIAILANAWSNLWRIAIRSEIGKDKVAWRNAS